MKINEGKNSKKKFRLSFIKNFTRPKKKDISTIKLPTIEDLENEFMFMLKKINKKLENDSQGEHSKTKFHANKRLLITRSIDDFARASKQRCPYSSLSSPFVHQSLLKTAVKRSSYSDVSLTTIPTCRINETTNSLAKLFSESIDNKTSLPSNLSIKSELCLKNCKLHWNENSLKLNSRHYQSHNAAIIDMDHQSNLALNKSLEKSHSSPLPMNRNQSSISNNPIQSAHLIDQYLDENKNPMSLYSYVSEMGENQSTESISSDEESVKRSLLQYTKKNLRHRWSFLDIWKTTMAKLPPILNRIRRKRLRRTGSREFLLEYDQLLSTNNNHHHRVNNSTQEQRYVEQERPIHSHIGLALLALLVFPPVGIIAFIFSIWSLCGQQDRHLSRKFGNTVYWISILAICLSFLLLFTLFTYFTYQYLTTHRIHRPITKDIDYTRI